MRDPACVDWRKHTADRGPCSTVTSAPPAAPRHHAPEQPAKEAGELEPTELHHRGPAADGIGNPAPALRPKGFFLAGKPRSQRSRQGLGNLVHSQELRLIWWARARRPRSIDPPQNHHDDDGSTPPFHPSKFCDFDTSAVLPPLPLAIGLHRHLVHLLGLLGRGGEKKLNVGSGRNHARAHRDELGGELRARRQATKGLLTFISPSLCLRAPRRRCEW